MRRFLLPLLIAIFFTPACTPNEDQNQQNTSTAPFTTGDPFEDQAEGPSDLTIHVWSLGGNGWAVEIGNRLLVFDYVPTSYPESPSDEESNFLKEGLINPAEVSDYEVYVFVTHSHEDHYDPSILTWEYTIAEIQYVFGWEAGINPVHHYLVGPRAQAEIGALKVYTINSHHAGVPEVAFLVDVEGIMIYHNGDYMGSYIEDFDYLSSVSNHIDIAFVIGWPYENHQQFQQALLLSELFSPKYMYASCREGDEIKCLQFADLLGEYGVSAFVEYAETRGEEFVIAGFFERQ